MINKFLNEFKAFALKGNVLDLAVGVIIGGAFGKIVTSLVNDIIMPLMGILLGGADFKSLFLPLGPGEFATIEAAKAANVATLNYGLFLQNVLDFLIVALCIFFMIKSANKLMTRFVKKTKEEVKEPTTKVCPFCQSEVSIKATRCPHCTSELGESNAV